MRRARHGLGAVLAAVLALTVCCVGTARASWYVADIDYTHSGEFAFDGDVVNGSGTVIGHITRAPAPAGWGGVFSYYAEATAIGTSNVYWNVIDTDKRSTIIGHPADGFGPFFAEVILGGSAPPTRPGTWPQRSNVTGEFSAGFSETGVPNYSGYTEWRLGTVGWPPTVGWLQSVVWEMDDPSPYSLTSGTKNVAETTYVSRTTTSTYRAGWVYTRAVARAKGAGQKQVTVWALGDGTGYVEHNP